MRAADALSYCRVPTLILVNPKFPVQNNAEFCRVNCIGLTSGLQKISMILLNRESPPTHTHTYMKYNVKLAFFTFLCFRADAGIGRTEMKSCRKTTDSSNDVFISCKKRPHGSR